VVLKARPFDWRHEVGCEIAAMRFAETHGLPVPRVLAVNLDGAYGVAGLVSTMLPGSSAISVSPDPDRLRAAGAAAAELHRIRLDPRDDLPLRLRQMPWIDWSEERRGGRSPTTALLDEVDARLAATEPTAAETVFVHGDLWQGNLLFEQSACTGIVDWEAAGAGAPGIDIGSLRWDAAILWDLAAADDILAGWEEASGRAAVDVAYFDLVAGANTPADLGAMTDAIAQQGRPDLDGPTLSARRDRFLERALAELGR
jgi:aminoglycoside phosphotransferase (APT) family kinase protein